ncbi:MAG TPA: FkbM family methyltransferase [Steroidobacteraceae bacterium]|nr:FkbM family methyltransferase [Steroidobacteraceae bacterium]
MGLVVYRIRRAPYDELWAVPRYTRTTVQLLDRPFTIEDSHSFIVSYREIFVDGIYAFECNRPDPLIIDCGSNYGTSIVYFKHRHPDARVIGVEADPVIFQLLRNNCAHLDVQLLQKAVSDTNEPVTFFSEGADGGRASHSLEAPKAVTPVQSVTLDELITEPVDFLKLDIEGSEAQALAACTKLDQVRQLFVEYHCFEDSPQALDGMLRTLREHGFRYYIREVFCATAPLSTHAVNLGMDLQLNVFAKRVPVRPQPARHLNG